MSGVKGVGWSRVGDTLVGCGRATVVRARRAARMAGAAPVVATGVVVAACFAAMPASARAQATACTEQPYYHVGCDDQSGPDRGKWAWNPGEPSNWTGLGASGNVHWWVQFGWEDARRHAALVRRDEDLPSLRVAFYDVDGPCGCDIEVLKVRTRAHLAPPALADMLAQPLPAPCPGSGPASMGIWFLSTARLVRGARFDLSVDARARAGRYTGGEANLLWEADGRPAPDGGCPGDPRARVWLGALQYCVDLRVRTCDPTGICCSTSHFDPGCRWSPCDR